MPAAARGVEPLCELVADLDQHVVVRRVLLHHRGVGPPVHHDVRRTVLGHHVEDPRVGQPSGDVVDQHGAGLERGPGDLVAHRVHRDRRRRPRPAPG